MDAQLLIWLVEHYTEAGETILDPMAGSGTAMLACGLGRNVVLVELEEKFCQMMRDNWEEVKMRPQLGSVMGDCQIIQGDARQLEGLLVDKCIFSPPYAEQVQGSRHSDHQPEQRRKRLIKAGYNPDDYQLGKGRQCEVVWEYGKTEGQLGNLPYGSIDSVITSPPYEGTLTEQKPLSERTDKTAQLLRKARPNTYDKTGAGSGGHGYTSKVDSIITSPPYEGSITPNGEGANTTPDPKRRKMLELGISTEHGLTNINQGYSDNLNNIGNLKSDSYLSAMLQVYQQCHSVLKPQGLMILVTKNFLREQKEIRLDTDTIALCEQAGFQFIERHFRILPAQSFWRVIYMKKYPNAPVLDKEDILVFRRV